MKAIYISKITIFLVLLGISYACGNDHSEVSTPLQNSHMSELSIAQARLMFDSVAGDCIEAYSETNYFSDKLFPGDYIPQWTKAMRLQVENRTIISCPISSSRHIISVGVFFKNNKSEIFSAPIKQFLEFEYRGSFMHVVLRNIIPDKSSGSTHNVSSPYEKEFSGIVCNYSLTGKLESVDRVICGNVVAQSKTLGLLSGLRTIGIAKIINTEKLSTRSYGEDDDWDDWDDWDDNNDDINDPKDPTTWTNDYWIEQTRPGGPYDDENISGSGEDEWESGILILLRHKPCGTIVGSVLLEEIENGIYYCPKCKKNVYFYF